MTVTLFFCSFCVCQFLAQAALKITRTALNMFTVSNRRDMYVFQDVKPSGVETIFYLK